MKTYSERHIRRSELFQLILLQHLYASPDSSRLIFQGGTALRWCHNSGRFSEDLDFVTHLDAALLERLLNGVRSAVARECIAHFGPGELTILTGGRREEGNVWRIAFEPKNLRERIMVKMECERLREGVAPDAEPRVLGMQVAVTYLIAAGELRIPRPNSVLLVETLEEILSDKVRALLERPYLKGRDLYDIWHLRERLGVSADRDVMERKFRCYAAPFTLRRSLEWLESADGELREAIETDLARFLPPEVMAVCRREDFRPFLDALKGLLGELRAIGVEIPN